jgi:uncharacterized protein YbgA (DUF1722 family)/uncharacterized protein YbbK (DUF523 family)
MYSKPNIVVSKCLEHGSCRYDGSMISSEFIRDMIPHVNFLPLCPEMAIGLPSPRESLRLVLENTLTKLKSYKLGTDRTDEMLDYARRISEDISNFQPDGFILKSRSPSCGFKDVKVYSDIGKAPPLPMKTTGIFGGSMLELFPGPIMEDEGRLMNFSIREHFYTYIFTLAAFRETVQKNGKMKDLISYHSKNKYLFMVYSQTALKNLGTIVANHDKMDFTAVSIKYLKQLESMMSNQPAKSRYINVMLHIMGYFKNQLSSAEKAHFLDMLELYRSSRIPQSAIMTMLGSWGVRFNNEYLKGQTVFNPFPMELARVTDSGKGI